MKKIYSIFILAFFVFIQTSLANTTSCSAQFIFTVSNYTVQFISASSTDSSLVNTWYFGDGVSGSSLANPSYTFSSCGTYTVFHQVEQFDNNGNLICQDSTFQVVTIICNTPCNAVASFSAAMVNNQTNLYEFVNNSSVTPNSSILCNWNFGDGLFATTQNLSNQVHTYGASGFYNVCLVITSGTPGTTNTCSDTFCMNVQAQVNTTPCNLTANFTSTTTSSPNTISFLNTSTGFAAGDSIRWTFGDGTVSFDNNPTHTYAAPGIYQVCLWIKKNPTASGTAPCVAELCYGVVVSNPCNLAPSFNYSPAPNQNNTFLFTNTTLTANAPQVTWTFGDSTTATGNVVTHSFTDPGTYWVCMHVAVSNSCYADTCMFVVVNSNPQPCNLDANFIWQTTPQNSTSAANAVYFLNTSLGYVPGDSITWTFGDGSNSNQANPIHSFAGAGPYNVCLRVAHNIPGAIPCVSEICHAVSIPPTLLAYPNPATNVVGVNIMLDSTTQIYAFLYNSQNVLVAQSIVAGISGNNTITFNTSNLAPGYYFIRIYYNGQFTVARFLKI